MSKPDATGSGRPLYTAGLALLAVAGISLLIAFLTWMDGDGEGGSSAVGTPPAPTTSAVSSTAAAPTTGESVSPSPGAAVAPGAGEPGAAQPGAGEPGGGQPGDAGQPEATAQPGGAGQQGGAGAPGEPGGAAKPGGAGGPDGAGDAGQPGAADQPGAAGRPGAAEQPGARQPGDGAAVPPGGEARPAPGGGGGAARPVDGERDVHRAELRVYNNSNIPGLAARAAEDFRSHGWRVVKVGNYSSGIIPTSTVYYERGGGQRAAAEALGEEFGLRVMPRFAGIRDATPGLIVIVTRDYRG